MVSCFDMTLRNRNVYVVLTGDKSPVRKLVGCLKDRQDKRKGMDSGKSFSTLKMTNSLNTISLQTSRYLKGQEDSKR